MDVIAGRLGKDAEETARILEGMYRKGTVLKHCEKDATSYAASVLGPGILEAVLKRILMSWARPLII